ncbi:MAG: metal-dependent hydrolase [Hyphomicrobiaceae bacterium]|nr:metal-dependent hydrolase [Hyphomicrobiaceae bacterium]
MANFTTHIGAGTVQAGILATVTLAADVVAPENLVTVTLAGVLGSVLPDIDLKDSRASKIMFSGLGVFASFVVLFAFAEKYSVVELMVLWLGTLAFVRYGLHTLFHRLSVHRGVWHSLLAGIFCAGLTAVTIYYVLGRHEGVAWLGGAFLLLGFIQHLVLDEIYSVDVMNRRIKASFGTALKIYDSRYGVASAAMAVAAVAAIWLAPSPNTFVDGLTQRQLWTELNQKLLPEQTWFGVFPARHVAVTGSRPPKNGDLVTGTLPDAATQSHPAPGER